jgi:hypothetical protein
MTIALAIASTTTTRSGMSISKQWARTNDQLSELSGFGLTRVVAVKTSISRFEPSTSDGARCRRGNRGVPKVGGQVRPAGGAAHRALSQLP